MTKDRDKLKSPPGLEKLASPELKSRLQPIADEAQKLATKMREAEQRLKVPSPATPPTPKGYDAPRRNVLYSILRELYPPDGPPDDVSTYSVMPLIKPLWAKTWCRLYPERKPPRMPGKGTVAAARTALKNLPR